MTRATDPPGFLESEIAAPPGEAAAFHIIPAGLERTVSYGGGTAAGPAAILAASQQLETFTGGDVPLRAGIHTQPAVPCDGPDIKAILGAIEDRVAGVARRGGVPVVLGGEHTVTLGGVRGLIGLGTHFGVVQFDAHADLRDSYEDDPFSHACVMRRVYEMGVPIFQLGVRSLSEAEDAFRRERGIRGLSAERIAREGVPGRVLPEGFPRHVYLTFDIDAFDPGVVPATGTPEPGGLGWYQALDLLRRIAAECEIMAFDVVELAPAPGLHAADFAAARLVYELIGMIARRRQNHP